jgi:ubiquinone/menaquinone biosynthesis C-methylase UbiE
MMKIEAIPSFVSGIYAFIARKSSFMRDIRARVVEEVCAKIPSGKVLDVGTGPGYLLFEIARKSPALELYGIDLSWGMVDMAKKTARKAGLEKRVQFEVANASTLPFQAGYFDFVVSTMSLHHWSDPAADFKEVCRVLKPGASAYIYDFRKDISDRTRVEVRQKYGWFVSHIFMTVARIHSWKTKKDAEDFLAGVDLGSCRKSVQELGAILRIELKK